MKVGNCLELLQSGEETKYISSDRKDPVSARKVIELMYFSPDIK